MNKENVKKLRDFIKKLPEKAINMPRYIVLDQPNETIEQAAQHTCGTEACIAGWAVLALEPRRRLKLCGLINPTIGRRGLIPNAAARLLGLKGEEAQALFQGYWSENYLEDIGKAEVLRKLNSMLRTGKV